MSTQSKLAIYRMLPTNFTKKVQLEVQRTFIVLLSLLKTHRRKAFLLSLGPSTILKFVTVMLPIIKLLPPTIKAIRTLSYFTKSNSNESNSTTGNNSSSHTRVHGTGRVVGSDGVAMTMDELNEILWTPAEESYWERVQAMVTRHGWYKTMGVSLAGVRPGRVEVMMPFRTEVSGEGGAFHASLVPTMIVLTGQLTGTTLLPRHFALQPIDLKCNILSACDASTFLLLARGAVIVRGDHSITVKVEILKASGQVPGSTQVATPSTRPPLLSWSSWIGSSTTQGATASSSILGTSAMNLVPGTGIERSKFVLCATGTQTSVIIRADTDRNSEEEVEMARLRKEREQPRTRASSSSTVSSSASTIPSSSIGAAAASLGIVGFGNSSDSTVMDESIILGDSFQLSALSSPSLSTAMAQHTFAPGLESPPSPRDDSQQQQQPLMGGSFFEVESPDSKGTSAAATPATITALSHTSISYASAVRYGTDQELHDHQYDETSDTEAWRK